MTSEHVDWIESPLVELMDITKNYGYFIITKIKHSSSKPKVFLDIWLLASEHTNISILTDYSINQNEKCCFYDNDSAISSYITGFARLIKYDTTLPEFNAETRENYTML